MTLSNAEIDHLSAKDYYREFRAIWSGKEIKLTDEVSMFTKGVGQNTLFIIGSQHGEEHVGAITLLQWAKKIANMKINGKICVVPLMNPRAWDLRKRSPGRLNMNRIWHENKCHRATQVKKVMKLLKKQMPLIYLDMHSDDEIRDNQPYICRFIDNEWGKDLQKAMNVSLVKGYSKKHDFQTSESYAHSIGINKSFTVEANPYEHIDSQVQFELNVINYCFEWANNKENWPSEPA